MAQEPRIVARYSRIPDHSDLRGFSYRAPVNYQWSDDHGSFNPRKSARDLGESVWASRRGFQGQGPKGYRRSDDRILEEACESLMRHPGIDASGMEVHVTEAVVTLSGTVPNRWMKRASEWVIDEISGVRDIRNKLEIA